MTRKHIDGVARLGAGLLMVGAALLITGLIGCSSTESISAPMAATSAPSFAAGGNAHWILDETRCDIGSLSCAFKAAGLGNNQGVTVVATAQVTVTYDCDNPGKGIHIPKAFQGIQSTARAQKTFYSAKNGVITGTISLSDMNVATSCPPQQDGYSDIVGGWQAVNVVIDASSAMTLSAPPQLPTLSY